MEFKPVHEAFIDHVKNKPRESAIYYFDSVIFRDELLRYAEAFSYFLSEHGVCKGDRVAIYTQNIPQFVIAQLASWFLGAIVVPLNIMFKQGELLYYFRDSGAKVLVSQEQEFQDNVKPIIDQTKIELTVTTTGLEFLDPSQPIPKVLEGVKRIKPLGDEFDFYLILKRYDGKKIDHATISPDDVALLSYTSGTTGPPKGAMNTHYNVFFNARTYKHLFLLNEDDVILGMAPLFHITGEIAHIATALYVGCPLILSYRFEAGEVLRLIEKWKATCTVAAITAFIALLNHPDMNKRNISSLKKIISGGAPVPPAIVDQWRNVTGTYIRNGWGMTETTSPAIVVPLGEEAPIDPETGALSIGKPVPGAEVKIIDLESGKDLPPGYVGEIVVKGPFVVKGYWNKPEETAQAIKNGWLHTGDIGKVDENGWVYYIDRKKDIINVSGFKVWPREVEDILYQHPAVKEVAVVGVPDPYRGESPKAFIVLKDNYKNKITKNEIIEFAKEKLARYKVPRDVEFVEELPKTVTGKILRRELKVRESVKS